MTACREFLEMMSASLDQALTPDEQARLDKHLLACPECRTAWKELHWTHAQIKGIEAVEPPPWLVSKTMARIRAEAAPQASFWRRFIRPVVMKPQLQVASILLLAATGFYLLKSQRSPSDVFGEPKQEKAAAITASQSAKFIEAGGQAAPESRNAPKEMQKPRSEGMDQSETLDLKRREPGFAQPPPTPVISPTPASPAISAMAKQERDRVVSGPPAAAPPAPSVSAGASVGAGVTAVAVVAESEVAPARQSKKTSKDGAEPIQGDRANRADEYSREKVAGATGQLAGQAERKDKSDAAAWVIRLEMADPQVARPLIERELARAGATLIPQREPGASRVLSTRLDPRRLPDLLSRLARVGKVLEQPDLQGEKASLVTIRISW